MVSGPRPAVIFRMLNRPKKDSGPKLWMREPGFTLLEVVLAVFLTSTVVLGSVVIMGTAVRGAAKTAESGQLGQLVHTQIESIKLAPFSETGDYPTLDTLPEGVSISIETSDSGANYRFPGPAGALVTNVVQRIYVTAADDSASVTMSFYKIIEP